MAYFKIGDTDYSNYVSDLKITKKVNYSSQTNAAGNTVADYINAKRTINVTIIPLNDTVMSALQTALDDFNVTISFRNPKTNALETGVQCIIPSHAAQYYTIQVNNVSYEKVSLTFIEL